MLKLRKLLIYIGLLLIPAAVAVALFVYTGSGYSLTEQEASDIAYQNAGVSGNEVTQVEVQKTQSGLHGSYKIRFSTADNQYTYTIDGQSGSILKHKSDKPDEKGPANSGAPENDSGATQESEESKPAVTKEAALTTALSNAGLAESSVTNIRNDLRDDAGGQVYDISFDYAASGLRYKYAVNAQSGAIVTYTTEYLPGVAATTTNTYTAQ